MKVRTDARTLDPQALNTGRPVAPQEPPVEAPKSKADSMDISPRQAEAAQVSQRLAVEGRTLRDAPAADSLVDQVRSGLQSQGGGSVLRSERMSREVALALLG